MSLSIGIVGADAGALTFALACRQAGLNDLTLYMPTAPAPARGLRLGPNATRILRALGVLEPLLGRASIARGEQTRSWRSGLLISSLPLGNFARQRYNAVFIQVSEATVQQALQQAVADRKIATQSLAPVPLDLATLLAGHDLLVSTQATEPPAASRLGTVWHGLVPAATLPPALQDAVILRWLGPGCLLETFHVDQDSQLAFSVHCRHVASPAQEPLDSAALSARFARWQPTVPALLAAATVLRQEPLFETPSESLWQTRTGLQLGARAHPAPGFASISAALAMEDAWVLSRMLDNYEDAPAEGIAEWQRYRSPRVRRVLAAAWSEFDQATTTGRLRVLRRNLRLGLTSRYLPELLLKQIDRLYQYDCVKGFN